MISGHVVLWFVDHFRFVQSIPHRGLDAVKSIADPIHITDLVSIVSRDRTLGDTQSSFFELYYDFGVEVPFIRVQQERDPGERFAAIDSVARVKFRQLHSDYAIFQPGEDPVSYKLV